MIYRNEKAIGQAIKNSGINRDEIFITTKLWNDDQRSNKVQKAIDTSLEKLGVDYIDLYLVHWPVPTTYKETWLQVEKIYRNKQTRAIGVSNHHQHHLEELFKVSDIIPAVNQIECYPYLSQEALIKFCLQHNIRPQAWGPLGATSDALSNATLQVLADKYAKTTAQVMLRWNLQRGVIVIPKTIHDARLVENFNLYDFSLTDAEMKQVSALNQDKRLGPDPENFSF